MDNVSSVSEDFEVQPLPDVAKADAECRHSADGGIDVMSAEMLTREEHQAIFERVVDEEVQMSVEEFMRRWDAGDFDNVDDGSILRAKMLCPA